jgi:hypothetical protein
MRERIDPVKAIRLYQAFKNWREVAKRMLHKSGMQFTTTAVQAAVRRYDQEGRMIRIVVIFLLLQLCESWLMQWECGFIGVGCR